MCEETGEPSVNTITAEEFEANCLELIDLVEQKRFTYIITKDGKPFVMMIPAPPQTETDEPSDAETTPAPRFAH
jgi:antitoxin (DNA-binding transcriptional repressor) of toxin-antitoxin stability system